MMVLCMLRQGRHKARWQHACEPFPDILTCIVATKLQEENEREGDGESMPYAVSLS
jgi:hypothetical protein